MPAIQVCRDVQDKCAKRFSRLKNVDRDLNPNPSNSLHSLAYGLNSLLDHGPPWKEIFQKEQQVMSIKKPCYIEMNSTTYNQILKNFLSRNKVT